MKSRNNEDDADAIWLITDPRLYYPLHQEKDTKKWNQRQRKRGSVDVYLWKAVIDPSKLQVEDHPQFKGVCLVKTDGKITSPRCPGKAHNSLQLHKDLDLEWEKAEVPKCRGGMSLLDCNSLVQAIVEYMKDNYPTTPEEFNFQAELKVVSHWDWFEGKESPRRKPGPRDDFRIKKAVKKTFTKWCKDVRDQESASQSSESDDEYISGLKEDICALKMYFNKGELEEDETENEKYSYVQYENEDECSPIKLKLTKDNAPNGVAKSALHLDGDLHYEEETLLKRRSGKRVRHKRRREEDVLRLRSRKIIRKSLKL
ncbi:hypothetical protein pdam_00011979, partial [Pocillopora damicornis]